MNKYIIVFICLTILISCNDKLDVKQSYDFGISTWQLPRELDRLGSTEIKFYLEREGDFADAEYFFEFFQTSGNGAFVHHDFGTLQERTRYSLEDFADLDKTDPLRWEFKLKYYNVGNENVEIDIMVTDNFKITKKLILKFDVKK